jgi:signal transduction histidine kinase
VPQAAPSQDSDDALSELTELQTSVHREYDELRAYMQQLAGIEASPMGTGAAIPTRFSLDVKVEGSIDLIDHLLQIAREGISNIRRHAAAATAQIRISSEERSVHISIDDDGVGLHGEPMPWSIASRVRELGGRIEQSPAGEPGSHLRILVPQC